MPGVICYPCGSKNWLWLHSRSDSFFLPYSKRPVLWSLMSVYPWKLDCLPSLRRVAPVNSSSTGWRNSISDSSKQDLLSISECLDGSIIFKFGIARKTESIAGSDTKILSQEDLMQENEPSAYASEEAKLETEHDHIQKPGITNVNESQSSDDHTIDMTRVIRKQSRIETTLEDGNFEGNLKFEVAGHDLETNLSKSDPNNVNSGSSGNTDSVKEISATCDEPRVPSSSDQNDYRTVATAAIMPDLCGELPSLDLSNSEVPADTVVHKQEKCITGQENDFTIVLENVKDEFPFLDADYPLRHEIELDTDENFTLSNVVSHNHTTKLVDESIISMELEIEEDNAKENGDTSYEIDGKTGTAGVDDFPFMAINAKGPSSVTMDVSTASDLLSKNQHFCISRSEDKIDSLLMKTGASMDTSGSGVLTAALPHRSQGVTATPVSTERLKWEEQVTCPDSLENANTINSYASEKSELSVGTSYDDRENLTAEFFLESAIASISDPHKALSGGNDFSFSTSTWIGIADGSDEWSLQGSYSGGRFAQELLNYCKELSLHRNNCQIRDSVDLLVKAAAKCEASGLCAIVIANIHDQVLHAVNIGNTGFCIIRNGVIALRSSPMLLEFNFPLQLVRGDDPSTLVEEFKFVLEENDIIILGSNCLFDNLYHQELASIVTKLYQTGSKPQHIAEILANAAHEMGLMPSGRTPFADAAQAAGYRSFSGGNLDHVSVVLSIVHKRLFS